MAPALAARGIGQGEGEDGGRRGRGRALGGLGRRTWYRVGATDRLLQSRRHVIDFLYFYVNANLNGKQWIQSLGLGEKYEVVILPAIMLFFILGGFAGNLLSAPLAERHGKKWVIAAGMVIAGAMLVPMIFSRDVWVAGACGTLLGLGWGAFIAADWAFACTLMPKQKTGSYMGIWDVTTLMPQVLAPVIAGPLRDGIFNARVARLVLEMGKEAGERAAEAVAHQWLYATIIIYFVVGLWLLKHVREPRISGQ